MYYGILMKLGHEALNKGNNDDALSRFAFAETQTNNEDNKARAQQMQALAKALGDKPVNTGAAIRQLLDELSSGDVMRQKLLLLMRASRQDRFKDLVSSVRLVRKFVHETSDRATGLISTTVAGGTRLLK